MRAMTCRVYNTVIILDHQPCLCTARSKHHRRTGHGGLFFGRFDGLCRLISFWRSIHSRWGCVSKAEPVLEVKLPMMILERNQHVETRLRFNCPTYLTKRVKITTPPIKL